MVTTCPMTFNVREAKERGGDWVGVCWGGVFQVKIGPPYQKFLDLPLYMHTLLQLPTRVFQLRDLTYIFLYTILTYISFY